MNIYDKLLTREEYEVYFVMESTKNNPEFGIMYNAENTEAIKLLINIVIDGSYDTYCLYYNSLEDLRNNPLV